MQLTITPTAEPETASDDVTRHLVEKVKSKGGDDLCEFLSENLNTPLKIDKVSQGSVLIDFIISDFTELENIKSLSDTGVLTNLVTYHLVTPELLAECAASKIIFKTIFVEASYTRLMEYSRG